MYLKSFSNNKSPVYDGLTNEFYKTFWRELKELLMNSIGQTKISEILLLHKGKLN